MRIAASVIVLFFYFVTASLWSEENPFAVWKTQNIRLAVPLAVVLVVFLEWYKPKQEEEDVAKSAAKPGKVQEEPAEPSVPSASGRERESMTDGEVGDAEAQSSARNLRASADNPNWIAAREIPHNEIPMPETDEQYLGLVHKAAGEGCVEALAKLGEYAWRRRALVESYYWYSMAAEAGKGLYSRELANIAAAWLANGCPDEDDNVYTGFSELCGSYARALLCIRSGIDVANARRCARELRKEML